MANYTVKAPDGSTHVISGPDGASDNEIISQAQKLFPQKTDWKGVVGSAVKNAFVKPGSMARDLLTNPETMSKALPPLMSIVGGISPIPGGATMGMGGGQIIRDLSLKALNKPIPGKMQHGLELGGAALGDIMAIPAIKGNIYGGQIGEAEKNAGIITRAPTKAVTPGSVGETLNNLEAQIDAGTINTPQAARDAQAVMKQVYKNPKIYEQTDEISVQAQRVGDKVSKLLNSPKMVPSRAVPNAAFSKAMTIPNAIGKGWQGIPTSVKAGMGVGGGAALPIGIYQIIKKLLGGSQ